MKKKELEQIISRSMQVPYDIDVNPPSWVLTNRARFINWIDKTFKRSQTKKQKATCEEAQVSHVSLFPHQSFVSNYMQFASPYRGLLLYHGIGVGKTFSSIAAAEILLNNMDVIVMLPASLHDNYVGEIRKYGATFYTLKQHWQMFDAKAVTDTMLQKTKLSRKWVSKNEGMWVPFSDQPPNFQELSSADQANIQEQIDVMIHGAFEFVHYNGLDLKKIEKMTEKGNPFDNKCVIIDEIHNLISMIANFGKIGRKLYKLLMSAQNMKLIMLSGTPIINYPREIAYLVNLVTGPRVMYEIKFVKEGAFVIEDINATLVQNKYIDSFEVDTVGRKIRLAFLPDGFAKIADGEVVREPYVKKEDKQPFADTHERIDYVLDTLKAIGMKPWKNEYVDHVLMTLPEKEEDFDTYFVDYENEKVKNPLLFMRRILGAVSFYKTYSPELYPDVDIIEVPLKMSDFHFNKYEKSREDERKQEKKSAKNKAKKTGLFSKETQVYKAFSRATCNFVFPEEIKRPFPSKLRQMQRELDQDALFDEEDATPINIDDEYHKLVKKALEDIKHGPYLTYDEIGKYSPKYKHIYDRMHEIEGPVLVYSQFRTVEGLGLFHMFLEANGYEELRVKYVKNQWKIEGIDPKKPKYVVFTGNNEETRLLLKIFNNDPNLPANFKDAVKDLKIKAITITKSGAEGISLKNVRQVHILEPYWNYIRIEQVIGRAVRTCSHIALPPEERNVTVYIYYMKATKAQLEKSRGVKVNDRGMTSDEHIYSIAKKKKAIIESFLDLMKRASVDCALNAHEHGGVKCFAFPTNILENKLYFVPNIERDVFDEQYHNEVEQLPWKGQIIETDKGKFLLRIDTDELYDWELYDTAKRLVKVGEMKRS